MGREDIEVDEQETTRLVRFVAKCLEEAGGTEGMNLFRFIVNPHDFGQTIENLFYLSFLVKENRACIEVNDDHEPNVCVYLPATPGGSKLTESTRQTRANHLMEKSERRTNCQQSRF